MMFKDMSDTLVQPSLYSEYTKLCQLHDVRPRKFEDWQQWKAEVERFQNGEDPHGLRKNMTGLYPTLNIPGLRITHEDLE